MNWTSLIVAWAAFVISFVRTFTAAGELELAIWLLAGWVALVIILTETLVAVT